MRGCLISRNNSSPFPLLNMIGWIQPWKSWEKIIKRDIGWIKSWIAWEKIIERDNDLYLSTTKKVQTYRYNVEQSNRLLIQFLHIFVKVPFQTFFVGLKILRLKVPSSKHYCYGRTKGKSQRWCCCCRGAAQMAEMLLWTFFLKICNFSLSGTSSGRQMKTIDTTSCAKYKKVIALTNPLTFSYNYHLVKRVTYKYFNLRGCLLPYLFCQGPSRNAKVELFSAGGSKVKKPLCFSTTSCFTSDGFFHLSMTKFSSDIHFGHLVWYNK